MEDLLGRICSLVKRSAGNPTQFRSGLVEEAIFPDGMPWIE